MRINSIANAQPRPQVAFLALQPDEQAGAADCGCLLDASDGPTFYLCPLHAAAPGMANAIRLAIELLCNAARCYPRNDRNWQDGGLAEVAISALLEALPKAENSS